MMDLYSREDKQVIEAAYQERISRYGSLMGGIDCGLQSLSDGIGSAVDSDDLQYSMKFIFGHLPVSDLAEEGIFSTVLDVAETALYARSQMPWGQEVPTDIFLADVLFPRVNNEWLEPVRKLFYGMLSGRVRNKTMAEAILETNYFCFEQATYIGSDIRTAPPSTLLKSARGRCGEESVFTIMAMRSIGIPARQIYVPRWAHCDSNHAWVEVWCGGQWYYLGACEPEEALDRGWFTSAASRAMLVENKAFYCRPSGDSGPVPKDPAAADSSGREATKAGLIYNVNRTARYAPARKLMVRVRDTAGTPVKGLGVSLEIINSAGFSPIITLNTDEHGEAEITIGKGSLRLHVTDGDSYVEQWVNTGEAGIAEVVWSPGNPGRQEDAAHDFNTIAPAVSGVTNQALDQAVIMIQKTRTEQALQIRKRKEAAFFGGELAELADEAAGRFDDIIDRDSLRDILVRARGNYPEIIGFLSDNRTRLAAQLLSTLNDKDYSDCRNDVLTAHVVHAAAYEGRWSEEIFTKYVLAPRIYFEHLTDYRERLAGLLTKAQRASFTANPPLLWEYLEAVVSYREEDGLANLIATPAAALRSRFGNPLSRKILFTAVLRSLGVPARLTRDTLQIEYYDGTGFIRVTAEEEKDSQLKLNFAAGDSWIYGFNWSVSALRNGIFEYLDLGGAAPEEGVITLRLTHGSYRVITSNRLPNGNTSSRQYDIVLPPGSQKELEISLRPVAEKDMISKAKINDFEVLRPDGTKTALSAAASAAQNILLWLVEDHEPSQHILNELLALQEHYRHKTRFVFLLERPGAAGNSLIAQAARALQAELVVDAGFANAEPSARMTFVDPDKLPLAVIADAGLATSYAISGYNVGTAEMMLKILNMVS